MYSITVVSHAPLLETIHNKHTTGQVTKWAIELMAFDINYEPQKAIKSRALIDFVIEWTKAQSLPRNSTSSIGLCTSIGTRCLRAWGLEWSSYIQKGISSIMCYRFTSRHPTISRSMKNHCTDCASPCRWVSADSSAMGTQIWFCRRL